MQDGGGDDELQLPIARTPQGGTMGMGMGIRMTVHGADRNRQREL